MTRPRRLRCVSAALLSVAAALSATMAPAARVLLLTNNSGSLTSQESARKSQFEGWGHTVTTIWDNDSQANFDAAIAAADVVWVTEESNGNEIGYKLRSATIGVVSGERAIDDEMGFATSNGTDWTENEIQIIDVSHPITSGLSTGWTTITSSNQPLSFTQGTEASGAQALASYSGAYDLAVLDAGATLANTYSGNSVASGRRVRLPWGGDSFSWSSLNSTGLLIAQRALDWASGSGSVGLMAHWKLDEGSGSSVSDSSGQGNGASFDSGSPTWTTGTRFGAVEFGGFDDIETDADFDPPAVGSVAFWFKSNNTPAGDERLMGVSSGWEVRTDATGAIHFQLDGGSGGGAFSTAASVAVAGRWRHVVAIYNADDDTFRLYLDGELVQSGAYTAEDAAAGRLSLGSRTGSTDYFDGALDDVRVYDHELTEAEVATIYGLVGHWRLDESSGVTASDSSLNANDGAHGSGVTPGGTGPNGQTAAEYDGGNNFTEVAHGGDWNAVDDQFSLATWVRIDAGSDTHGLIIWDDTTTPYALLVDSSNRPTMRINWSSSGNVSHTASGALTVGQWHHVAVTYDRSTVRFFIDGVEDASTLSTSTSVDASTSEMQLGGDDGSSYDLTGALHDARVYNRALLSDEVADLAGSTSVDGLVGHWKLDETTGAVAADSSGKGNDGSYDNGVALGQTGVRGKAAAFDGLDDVVTVPGNSDLNVNGSMSVACWAKSDGSTWNATGMLVSKRNQFVLHPWAGENRVTFFARLDGAWAGVSVEVNSVDRWRQYVGVWDQDAGQLQIYVDGELRNTSDVGAGTVMASDTGDLLIGSDDGYSNRDLDGSIDDVVLYDRVMTQQEIAEHYGLVAHWRLNETTGSVAADSSVFGRDANHTGSTILGADAVRVAAVDFDGADAAVSSDEAARALDGAEAVSIAAWVRPDTLSGAAARIAGNGRSEGFRLEVNSSNRARFVIHKDGLDSKPSVTATTDLPTDRWTHLVGVYDGVDLRLYIDGQLHREVGTNGGDLVSNTHAFIIGNRSGNSAPFDGRIDDVVAYDRAMTDQEIAEHYGLVGHWKLDEASGATAADSGELDVDLAAVGSPGWTTDGVRSGATTLGFGDYFQSDEDSYGSIVTEAISFACWFRLDDDVEDLTNHVWLCEVIGTTGSDIWLSQNGHDLRFRAYDGAGASVIEDGPTLDISPGVWSHAAVVFDGTELRIYVDGELHLSTPYTSGFSPPADRFRFGRNLAGEMDDLVLYNRAMTEQEIAEHYGLVGHWKLDETSGAIAYDSSGMGNHGAWQGVAASADGRIDQAALFDGASAIQVPGLVTSGGSASLSAWVYLTDPGTDGAEVISLGDDLAIRVDAPTLGVHSLGYDGTGWPTSSTGYFVAGASWRHVTAVYNADTLELCTYINGVNKTRQLLTSPITFGSLGADTWIGAHGDGKGYDYTGRIDDARVYNRAISADEARELYYGEAAVGLRIISWREIATP